MHMQPIIDKRNDALELVRIGERQVRQDEEESDGGAKHGRQDQGDGDNVLGVLLALGRLNALCAAKKERTRRQRK